MKHKRTEHEKKIDIKNHYDCLETDVREEARKNFKNFNPRSRVGNDDQ